jgi:hypothetical protein
MNVCTVLIRLLVTDDAENPLVLADLDRGVNADTGISESGSG